MIGPLLAIGAAGAAVAFVALNKSKSAPKNKPIVWTRDTSGRIWQGRAYRLAVTVQEGQGDAMAEALMTTGIDFKEFYGSNDANMWAELTKAAWPNDDPDAADPRRFRYGGLGTKNAQVPPVGNIIVWTTS